MKGKDESFTKVILRLTRKKATGNLLDYVRTFAPDHELADRLEEVLEERQKIHLESRGRTPRRSALTPAFSSTSSVETGCGKEAAVLPDHGEPLTTTPISAAELFKGSYRAKDKKTETARARDLLEYLELLDMPISACENYGKLRHELSSKGFPIGDLDTLIASTALVHRQILLTRNKTHFEKIPGLIVETW